jgi:MoxR-like ATPase
MPDLQRYITFGASPAASIDLILTARALAFIRGRSTPSRRTSSTWP